MKEQQQNSNAYLLPDVIQRVWRVDGIANQNDMGVWIRQRAQAIVVLLTRSVPQRQLDSFAVAVDVGDIVFEDGGDVRLR